MSMIKVGDKITLKKEMGMFKNIGEECEVFSVADGIISFKFGDGLHLGCMSEDELDRYFTLNETPAPPCHRRDDRQHHAQYHRYLPKDRL